MSALDPAAPWKNRRITVRGEAAKAGAPTFHSDGKCVVYWMQRAQRATDNPALDVAIEVGNALGLPVVVFLGIVPFYPHANWRHYRFLVEGIAELGPELARRGVGLVLRAYPEHSLARFAAEVKPALVVGDENPLRETEAWRVKAAQKLGVPLWTVDADVVVPSKLLLKEQWAARTIRPRIHALLPEFLVSSDEPQARVPWRRPRQMASLDPADGSFLDTLPIDRSVPPVASWRGGMNTAKQVLARFVRERLGGYDQNRNQPSLDATSELSPYLHFGHIGPRAVALAVRASGAPAEDVDAFIEQLVVRRELSINFVRFNPRYDSLDGCEAWAKRTLAKHRADPRPVKYPRAQMENAETGDPLWNAAQQQMLYRGWMHNYLRMYWAKKILEWSDTPEQAFETAVTLNDKYFLDGRDPNGYAGIAWAIGGKHDRGWGERAIFGTVRFMSYASTSKKFDSKAYVTKMGDLARAATSARSGV